MKIVLNLTPIAVMLVSFSSCCMTDCPGMQFRFQLLDKDGKDLVHDLHVPTADIHLYSADLVYEFPVDDTGGELQSYPSTGITEYVLVYDNKDYDLTLAFARDEGRCCTVHSVPSMSSLTLLIERDVDGTFLITIPD